MEIHKFLYFLAISEKEKKNKSFRGERAGILVQVVQVWYIRPYVKVSVSTRKPYFVLQTISNQQIVFSITQQNIEIRYLIKNVTYSRKTKILKFDTSSRTQLFEKKEKAFQKTDQIQSLSRSMKNGILRKQIRLQKNFTKSNSNSKSWKLRQPIPVKTKEKSTRSHYSRAKTKKT